MITKPQTLQRGPLPDPEDCQGCPFADADGRPRTPVRGIGPTKPRFVAWGEGPGGEEIRQGSPFIGESGQLLTKALVKTGNHRDEIWIGNSTLCIPPRGTNKETQLPKAVEHCRKRALKELAATGSVPILALGKFAMQSFLGDEYKITEVAGCHFEVEVGGVKRSILPTIHPAHILRGGGGEGGGEAHAVDLLFYNLLYDTAKAGRLADGKQAPFKESVQIEYRNAKKAEQLLEGIAREARATKLVACDTETLPVPAGSCKKCPSCEGHSALESFHARLLAIGLATEQRAVSVAWRILTPRAKDVVKKLLADPAVIKTFHNSTYDVVVLKQHGLPVIHIEDTLLAHHNAFPGLDHKLQRVATQFFLVPNWKSEYRHGKGTDEELHKYNGLDAQLTAKLHPILQVIVKKSDSERTYEIDRKMASVAARMTEWGIPIDLEENRKLHDELKPRVDELEAKLMGRLNDPGIKTKFLDILAMEQAKRKRKKDPEKFLERHAARLEAAKEDWEELNLDAKDQVVALLKACGVPLYAVTKKGATSTRKEVLQSLAGNHIVSDILIYRAVDDLFTSFVAPMPSRIDNDGRTHPVWSVHKITGRWGSKPNFQNFHKGNVRRGTPNLRRQVVAPPGWLIVSCDKAQLEARCIALLSKEPYLLNAFLRGVDIHSEFAKLAFPGFAQLVPKTDTWKEQRDYMKRAEYGYMYRALPITCWKQSFVKEGYGDIVSLRTVLQMFKVLKERMPYVERWQSEKFRKVTQTGELREFILGRRRTFPLGQIDATVVANHDIQSMGASMINQDIDRFDQAILANPKRYGKVQYLIQGHDSFTVLAREDKAEKVRDLMGESFYDEFELDGVRMTFPAEPEIARTWAEV